MATKNVHQDFSSDALSHLNIAGTLYRVPSFNNVYEVMLPDWETDFDKVKDLLNSETPNFDWKTCKKAFILPKCPVSMQRLKSKFREDGITVTNDYEKADFIVTHDKYHKRYYRREGIQSTALTGVLNFYHVVENPTSGLKMIYTKHCGKSLSFYEVVNEEYISTGRFLSGMSINLAHLLDTKKIKGVVNVDTVMSTSALKQELTDDLYESLVSMLQSTSEDEIAMICKILPTIDVNAKHHNLYKLQKHIRYKHELQFNRDKDVKHWFNSLKYYYQGKAQRLIVALHENNELTNETFKSLELLARDEVDVYNRDIYTVHVKVAPEFKTYCT